ncbi:hypothetical protein [Oerskovia paurometabola]|uniref:hypothetical protein n=1 Tax=Oerskovia paurometabola TaxID=162170 RepID=UPI0037F4F7B3
MNDKQQPSTPLHLDAAFSDIAASAGAAATDGTTGTVEVHRLVKRSRRRRAAAFGTGGFVLLGVAGIGLSGLLAPAPVEILPAPPVSPAPTAPPSMCGTTLDTDPDPRVAPAWGFDLRSDSTRAEVGETWTGDVGFSSGRATTTATLSDIRLVATRGGEVVGVVLPTGEEDDPISLPVDGSSVLPLTADLVDCLDTSQPLGEGDYVLYVQATLGTAGGNTATWVTSPVPLEVVTAGQGSEPPPEATGPEPGLAPIEVRDVIGDDDSAVFEAFREAAATGAPATVDLTFAVSSDWQVVEVVEQDGVRRLSLPRKAEDLPRPRTTSDDGWSVEAHGGALFSDASTSSWPSDRLVGTYDVTRDESGGRPRFVLRVVDGGTPATAPPTRDREICEAITASVNAESAYPADLAADLRYLLDHPEPGDRSPRHAEIRARWIDSPRVWWAMQIDVATQAADPSPNSKIAQVC